MFPPVIAQPDLERFVVEQLEQLPGVTSFAYSAQQLDGVGWIYAHYVQVDARAGRKSSARDLAEQARQVIIGLPAVPWADGVVCYAAAEEGPMWLPDSDGGPRYCARYEIRVHPSRDNWQPAAGLASRRAIATPQAPGASVPAT
jgi:hypothetical protein